MMDSSTAGPSATGKEFIVLMAAIMSTVAVSIDAMLPALAAIGAGLGVADLRQTQFVIVCFFGGMALGQLFCGPLSDALGRRRLLLGSYAGYLVGTLICLFTPSFEGLLVGRVVQGLAAAGPYVSVLSIVRDRHTGAAMASVMSLVTMIFIMVPVVAPSLGQLVLLVASWREVFLMLLIYGGGVAFWAWARLAESLPAAQRRPFRVRTILEGARAVLATRATVCYMLCSGCIFGILIGYLNSCLLIFQELYGVGDLFAVYFGGLALTLGLASLLNSHLVQRFGMRAIVRGALLTVLLTSLALVAYQAAIVPTLLVFMAYATVLFFCLGLTFGNINALAMEPMGDIAGTASAAIGFTSSVISLLTGTVIGLAYNATIAPLLIGAAVLAGVSLVLMHLAPGAAEPTAPLEPI